MTNTTKRVSYQTSNSYETLNSLTKSTKNIWVTLHGMGFLSRYFLRPFQQLNSNENYIIAPQAPSKYYLKDEFKYVGASWLTKEDTQAELLNVLSYLDAVFSNEEFPENKNLILFGFYQGVSIIARYLVKRKLNPSILALYAGGIPHELTKQDFDHLDYDKTKIKMIYGDQDHFLTPERLKGEFEKTELLFGGNVDVIKFEGGHEILPEILQQLIADN